jgi:hypothetical protein
LDAVIAREVGKRKLERIPVRVANPDRTPGDRAAWTPDLVSIPEGAWEGAVKRFKSLKSLLEMDRTKRTLEKVQEVADAVGKHPATIYRWLEAYERSERVSVFLRKAVRIVERIGFRTRSMPSSKMPSRRSISRQNNPMSPLSLRKFGYSASKTRSRTNLVPILFGRESRPFLTVSNLRSVRTGRLQLKDTSLSRATSLALTIP